MNSSEPTRGRFDGPAGLAVILLAVIVGAALLERLTRPESGGERTPPTPMPPLLVEGWLNVNSPISPSVESLRGKWVIVDSWATHCGYCLKSMPRLSRLYRRWREEGVEMLGLTSEPAMYLPQIEAVLDRYEDVEWPIGYGAGVVNGQLGASMLPTYTLFDPQGRSVWRGHTVDDLEIELANRL